MLDQCAKEQVIMVAGMAAMHGSNAKHRIPFTKSDLANAHAQCAVCTILNGTGSYLVAGLLDQTLSGVKGAATCSHWDSYLLWILLCLLCCLLSASTMICGFSECLNFSYGIPQNIESD